jgi:hypothetical protein
MSRRRCSGNRSKSGSRKSRRAIRQCWSRTNRTSERPPSAVPLTLASSEWNHLANSGSFSSRAQNSAYPMLRSVSPSLVIITSPMARWSERQSLKSESHRWTPRSVSLIWVKWFMI